MHNDVVTSILCKMHSRILYQYYKNNVEIDKQKQHMRNFANSKRKKKETRLLKFRNGVVQSKGKMLNTFAKSNAAFQTNAWSMCDPSEIRSHLHVYLQPLHKTISVGSQKQQSSSHASDLYCPKQGHDLKLFIPLPERCNKKLVGAELFLQTFCERPGKCLRTQALAETAYSASNLTPQ